MNKEFLEGLASFLNIPAEEVSNIVETDEESKESKLKEGVNLLDSVKGWVKTRNSDIFKEGHRKGAKPFESWIKKQGFESDTKGPDILAEYFATVKTEPGKGGDPSEWEKKYNDLAPKVENLQKALADKDGLIAQKEAEWNKRFVTSQLSQNVRSALGDKWAGSDDHFKILMNNFDASRIKYEGETPVLLDAIGEPLKDDLHRPVAFKEHVLGLGKLIGGFHAVDPGKGGAPPSKGGSGGENGVTIPANISGSDFQKMYMAAPPEKQAVLLKAWRERKQ